MCCPLDAKGNYETPPNKALECCRKHVMGVISTYKPKVVVALGNGVVFSLFGARWKKDLGGIAKWRGFTIPDPELNAWICPTYSTRYIQASDGGVAEVIWQQDLEQAIQKAGEVLPVYKAPMIEEITDLTILQTIPKGSIIAFDYETTGLKPHAKGHRIVCVSVAYSPDKVYVFLMPGTKRERQPFVDLLARPDVYKMAHNMKFEETWSFIRLKQHVQGWLWDSMQAAHILDNRKGVCGLKFQAFVNFGVADYSSEIAPYLKGDDDKCANSMNRVQELLEKPDGKDKLLRYCALDSIYEYRLAMLQREQMLPI
jgi:hypothetical protein